MRSSTALWTLLTLALLICTPTAAQVNVGELRLTVLDPGGNPVVASGELIAKTAARRQQFTTDQEGRAVLRALPYGAHMLRIEAAGFQRALKEIKIHSPIPISVSIRLILPIVQQEVAVSAEAEKVRTDPATRDYIPTEQIRSYQSQQPGRVALDLVASQPGWLMEANGVLHPRGSEYQVQWVIDGIPLTDNRSPGFATLMNPDLLQSFTVWTAGLPAEYGRKLGGVVDVVTIRPSAGVHGTVAAGAGAANQAELQTLLTMGLRRFSYGMSFETARSNRFLDPPVRENFHNTGFTADGNTWLDLDLTAVDRLHFGFSASALSFQVPNELVQQADGQDQNHGTNERSGSFSYQHIISSAAMVDLRFSSRDVSAFLESNPESNPIAGQQQRGFAQNYVASSITFNRGRNEWKAGADLLLSGLHEQFSYSITDPEEFAPDVPLAFSFHGNRHGTEAAGFMQDRISLRNWSIQAGLRWDHYRLLVHDHAFSPRLSVMWHSEGLGLSAHASYDRVFQTPAIENLLLGSSLQAQQLSTESTGLPVPPSRGNYLELGGAKTLRGVARLDVNWFSRMVTNFADDDIFLNTGLSFPIAFARARINGTEVKLSIPSWKRAAAQLSYSNLIGRATLPVTGGLLLEGGELLHARGVIPITQDQRNTFRGMLRYRVAKNIWLSTTYSYGSGLPFEGEITGPVDPQILPFIDLARQRVKPSYSVDAQISWQLLVKDRKKVLAEAQITNIFDRFDLINFAGTFSGTAIAPPRGFGARLRAEF